MDKIVTIKEKQTKKIIKITVKTHGDAIKKKVEMSKHYPDADITIN